MVRQLGASPYFYLLWCPGLRCLQETACWQYLLKDDGLSLPGLSGTVQREGSEFVRLSNRYGRLCFLSNCARGGSGARWSEI